ncbi:hypothetical protein [Nocardia sp. NPDC050710]|uniref:PPE domain-containing protein n=1 Tax=Nocardia sp. NPDC050710 TaxID=3157220 RepID=UPI0033E03653
MISDSRDDADDNKKSDQDRANDQKETWDKDRGIVNSEYSSLLSESGAGTDGKVLTFQDPFETMGHQEIYDALRDVDQNQINLAANGWRDLARDSRSAVDEFSKSVEQSITDKWNGKSGSKAIEATRQFATSFTKLAAGFQLVGHGLDLMQGHLAQAKGSVGQPDNYTFGDKVIDALPFQSVVKGPTYRAEEAEEQARYVMTNYYRPGAIDVDGKTPVLAEPSSKTEEEKKEVPKVPGSNPGSNPGGNPGSNPGSNPGGTTPQGTTPQSTNPQSTNPQSTDPQSTNPAGTNTDPSKTKTETPTTPQSANPSTPNSNLPSSNVPKTGSPKLGSSGTPSTPGGTPSAGKSVPGSGTQSPSSSGKSSSSGKTGASGRSGMPGMGGGGAGRGKGDDDDEHQTPDYLVYDRGDELLGSQPPALPPGGVIGG